MVRSAVRVVTITPYKVFAGSVNLTSKPTQKNSKAERLSYLHVANPEIRPALRPGQQPGHRLDPCLQMGYAHRAIALTMLPTPDWHGPRTDLDRS